MDAQADASGLPCHGHGDVHPTAVIERTNDASEATDTQAGHACNTCQVCHSSALATEPARQAATLGPQTPPRAAAARFATLPVAPGFKPPIS